MRPKQAATDFVPPKCLESTAGVAVTNFECLGIDFTFCGWPYKAKHNNILCNITIDKKL